MNVHPDLDTMLHERDKYRAIWRHDAYRTYSPGEEHLPSIMDGLQPTAGASFIDFGCGTGRAAALLAARGFQVLGVDFAENSRDANIDIPFLAADLTDLPAIHARYGVCTDVMEHIPTARVDEVLLGIARCADAVFFSIATVPDAFGKLVGESLHLTVRDAEWWRARLSEHWSNVRLADLGNSVLAVCSSRAQERSSAPTHFVSADEQPIEALCNVPDEQLYRNIATNSRRMIPWLVEQPAHRGIGVLVGGGPSLASQMDFIRGHAETGHTIVGLNNAATWLQCHDVRPEWQFIVDARPENVEFVRGLPARRYILSSQCDPSLFDFLVSHRQDVLVLQHGSEGVREHIPAGSTATLIGGSYTAGLIALAAMHALGFRQIHLYGYDSSDADNGDAHAYRQELNDQEKKRIEVWCEGRMFRTSYAMYKQAEAFPKFALMLADADCQVFVHGDGLLPTMARVIAERVSAALASQGEH